MATATRWRTASKSAIREKTFRSLIVEPYRLKCENFATVAPPPEEGASGSANRNPGPGILSLSLQSFMKPAS